MKSFLLAITSAALFGACLYFVYMVGFDNGVVAAQENCGNALVNVAIRAGAPPDVVIQMVKVVCYGE